jgi:adenosylcobinamide-phosphate synthase
MMTFMPLAPGTHGDALVLLLAMLIIDLFLGLVPGAARFVPDGAAIFTSVARGLERRLNREGRTRRNLIVRGAIVTFLLVALGAATGLALSEVSKAVPYGWAMEALVLLVCISGRRVFHDLRRGLAFAGANDIEQGRALVAELTGRDSSRLDRFGLVRVVIETGTIGFSRRIVVPMFWYLLLGLPGLLASRAVTQIARAVLLRDREGRAFGAAALSLDHALGLLPSYLAACFLCLAAGLFPRARVGGAFHYMAIDAHRDVLVNDGRVKGAVAGALGLALGGPFGTRGGGSADAWIGNGRARVGQGDIRSVFYLCAVASLFNIMLVALLTLVLVRL